MSFRGEIQTMPLPDLLQWLSLNHKTGTLELWREVTCQKFYFSEGALASAVSTPDHTSGSERDVKRLLTEALGQTEGRFDFIEAPLPEEIAAINLRLHPQQLLLDISGGVDEAQPESGGEAQGAHGVALRLTPAEGLRLTVFDRLMRGDFKAPLLPAVAAKVMEITGREDYSLRDLSDAILTDQVIAAQLLKQANSALYGGERYIASLPEAVQRLGSETVTTIVLSLSLQSMRVGRDLFPETRQQLWQHASACSLLARIIALPVRLDHNLAFLCGLMMDIGKLVLLSLIQEVMTKARNYQAPPAKVVKEVIEAYHQKPAEVVGEKWHLPDPVCEAITCHHTLTAASKHRPYVAIASLSDRLVTLFSQTDAPPVEGQSMTPTIDVDELVGLPAARSLGFSSPQMTSILERVPECLRLAQEFLMK